MTPTSNFSTASYVAVLKLKNVQGNIPTARLGNSDKLDVGEKVLALGRPQGYGFTVTAGVISSIFKVPAKGAQPEYNFIQTDAAINQGQAGGPLVNLDGQVIGMCLVQGQSSPGGTGINFALPLANIQDAINNIIRVGGTLATLKDFGFSGIQDITDISVTLLKLAKKEGALVVGVDRDSPLEKAGVLTNNVIVEFNGKAVGNAAQLKSLVEAVRVGSKVNIKLVGLRNRKISTLSVDVQTNVPTQPGSSGGGGGGISDDPADADGPVTLSPADDGADSLSGGQAVPVTSATGTAGEFVTVAAKAAPQVVAIGTASGGNGGGDILGRGAAVRPASSSGIDVNGMAIMLPRNIAGSDKTRYLITAAHLVSGRETVPLIFYRRTGAVTSEIQATATVVGTDPKYDLAVLKVTIAGTVDQLAMNPFLENVDYGEEVLAIGNARNYTSVVTAGVISMKNFRPRDGLASGFWATSARIGNYNDGGALVNVNGRFIGMCVNVSGYYARTGISLVVPVKEALQSARDIINTGKAKSGYLGLDEVANATGRDAKGVVIQKVAKGSPAEKAGLKEGQTIVRFGGSAVRDSNQLKALVIAADTNKPTAIGIIDTDGKEKVIAVEITQK